MPAVAEIKKHDFLMPTDLLDKEHLKTSALAALVLNLSPLAGTWLNCNKKTPGLVKVVITVTGNAISVHPFGACVPTPCDWGNVSGFAYADNVSATPATAFTAKFKFSFKETTMTGRLDAGVLMVETFNHFIDNSGRSDYVTREFMHI